MLLVFLPFGGPENRKIFGVITPFPLPRKFLWNFRRKEEPYRLHSYDAGREERVNGEKEVFYENFKI